LQKNAPQFGKLAPKLQTWRKVMSAYRRVYDSRHLQADCQEPGSAPEPYARQSTMVYLCLFHSICKHATTRYLTKVAAVLAAKVRIAAAMLPSKGANIERTHRIISARTRAWPLGQCVHLCIHVDVIKRSDKNLKNVKNAKA